MKREVMKKVLTMISGIVLSMILFVAMPTESMAYTQTTGLVSATAAKVRKEPTTDSDVVAGLLKGSTVTVIDEVTDNAGTMWYKVTVEGSTGYIRSDLLLKANPTSSTTSNNTQTTQTTQNTTSSKPAATTVKAIAETKAYVNYDSARVREGASTNHEIVGSAVKNTPVTITGEAKANDGKLWYQVKYNNTSGREVVGFIRSDLLTIGEPPAPAETETSEQTPQEQPAEGETAEGEGSAEGGEAAVETPVVEPEPEPEVTEKPDYEMVFTQNKEGVEEWYLYDNINGTRQTLAGLMAAAEAATKMSEANNEQASTQKLIIIILAVIVAILAVAVTLLLFKLKDAYDDGYEDEDEDDEDEDDEDEDDEPVVHRRRVAATAKPMKETEPVKAEKPVREKSAPAVKKVDYRIEEEAFEAGQSVAEKPQPKRKAKNFLIDDDEFEFEFLNMDDKK